MGIRKRILVAAFLPAVAALAWPIAGSPFALAESEQQATCTADGTALQVEAEDNTFDKDCLAVPPDQAFTIEFTNEDVAIPHNVSLYDTANGNQTLYKGDIVYGPRTVTYTVPAQPEGTYEFICDPHAEFMRGTFIVG